VPAGGEILLRTGTDCVANVSEVANVEVMQQRVERVDSAWRKSRLAARLLLKKESRPLKGRELAAAQLLSVDPEVTNRLIQQGLYFLGIGERKEAFDRKFGGAINGLDSDE
jgi:hypothetical protein